MGQVSAGQVVAVLGDIDYPATKEAIVDHAVGKGGDDEVVRALRSLPLGEYANDQEVVRSIDTVEATGQGAGESGAQARRRTQHGLAEHQRRVD